MEAVLFVQNPHLQNGRDGIDLVWIPEPIQRLCLGKTGQQCAAIDYCIRTTTKTVAMCRDLGIPLSLLPSYPSGMRPMRQHTVTFFAIQPSTSPVKSIAMLQDFYRGLPPVSLDRLSMRARVKARIRYTRKADDDDLDVFEILSVAPF
ncbi:MAG TPA: hypothetical protein VKR52_13070 [Terracidiphilus sp.]|nr:hypothetical protein [Terracidiphilus sp.]